MTRNACHRDTTRGRQICGILPVFLVSFLLFGCATGQSLPGIMPGQDDAATSGVSRLVAADPAGPIAAPSLPPSLAAAAKGAAATRKPYSDTKINYNVECTVKTSSAGAFAVKDGTWGEGPGKEAGADAADAGAIVDLFKNTSGLYLLREKPPHTLAGLDQRMKSSLRDGLKVLHSMGYYDGEVHGSIDGLNGEDGGAADDGSVTTRVRVSFITGQRYTLGTSRVETMTGLDLSCGYAARKTNKPDPDAGRTESGLPCNLDDVGLSEGGPVSASSVLSGVDHILDEFHNKGYPFAKVVSTRHIVDRNSKKMASNIHIEPGQFVRAGGVELAGATPIGKDYFENMRRGNKGQPWRQGRDDSYHAGLRPTGMPGTVAIRPPDTSKTVEAGAKKRTLVAAFEGPRRGYHTSGLPAAISYSISDNLLNAASGYRALLKRINFETLHSAWTAKVNFAYSSFAQPTLRRRPLEQFQSEIALTVAHYIGTYYSKFTALRERLNLQAFFPMRGFAGIIAPKKASNAPPGGEPMPETSLISAVRSDSF